MSLSFAYYGALSITLVPIARAQIAVININMCHCSTPLQLCIKYLIRTNYGEQQVAGERFSITVCRLYSLSVYPVLIMCERIVLDSSEPPLAATDTHV
ncbi:hypothetical protein DM02DRAFT_660000 [Periconia macrospinosa]|uniref:Secreted protein n=1 Tax=Periconia macrospinosa TaxID=97972 RepID=A0A2V1DC39_9PLEO|nr:hypothetical protein DM02DRAFT_660000 [Periconia macrospinosa]